MLHESEPQPGRERIDPASQIRSKKRMSASNGRREVERAEVEVEDDPRLEGRQGIRITRLVVGATAGADQVDLEGAVRLLGAAARLC
jgi:hypothetical protein